MSVDGDAGTGERAGITTRQLGCFILAAAVILAVVRRLRHRPPTGA